MVQGLKHLDYLLLLFWANWQRVELEVEQLELGLAPKWDVVATEGGLTHCATTLILRATLLKSSLRTGIGDWIET